MVDTINKNKSATDTHTKVGLRKWTLFRGGGEKSEYSQLIQKGMKLTKNKLMETTNTI